MEATLLDSYEIKQGWWGMITQPCQISIILAFFLLILCGIAMVSMHYRKKYETMKIRYEDLKSISNEILNMVQDQLK